MSEIVPFVGEGLGNSAYLVDLGDRRALVLDPWRDIGPYRRLAPERGLTLAYAVETHIHTDFVSGSRELAAEGATVVAPRGARLAFPHRERSLTLPDELPVYPAHGGGSSAASLMEQGGRVAAVFLGGPDDWAAATRRRLETGA